jgi:hypothetical protein
MSSERFIKKLIKLSMKLKKEIAGFYCRDDISYQMPGKRDTIVLRQGGTKSTHQKWILLYNIREVHQIFLSEYSGSGTNCFDNRRFNGNRLFLLVRDASQTSFAEQRPKYRSTSRLC